jgi:monofunctional glycosyltransferase
LKGVKWLAAIAFGLIALYASYIGIALYRLPSVAALADRKLNLTIQVKDWQGKLHPFAVGPRNPWWTTAESIPSEMEWAVIVAEDTNFYRHEGIDVRAIKNAIKYDLEKKRLVRGASTITQQTAKNLFPLSRLNPQDKTNEKRFASPLLQSHLLLLY